MSMPGIWELIIILLIIIVLFGGNKAFATIKEMGREVQKIKKKLEDFEDIKNIK